MKKTQLKNIIKESIKELMTEQSTTDYWIQITACWGSEVRWRHTNAVNGGVPQVGQMLGGIWDGAMGRTWFITGVTTSAPSFSVIPCTPWAQATDPCDKPLYTGTTCCPQLCGTITGGGNTTDSNSGLSPTWMPNQPIPASITGLHNIGCSGSGPKCCGNSSYDPIQMSSNWFMVQYFGQVGTPLCSGYTGTHPYCDVCCCTPENAPVNEQVADIGCRNGTFYHATNPDCECKPGEIQVDCTWRPAPDPGSIGAKMAPPGGELGTMDMEYPDDIDTPVDKGLREILQRRANIK